MKKFLAAAAIGAITLSTPALAQDGGGIQAYAGVLVGYDNVRVDAGPDNGSDDGVVYGALIGAQSSMGEMGVIGLEAELTDANVSERAYNLFEAGDSLKVSTGRDFFVGARAGYYAQPGLLLYVKGGYTNLRAKARYEDSTGVYRGHDDLDGYRVGAGAEFGEGRLRFRGEYRYSDYGALKDQGVNTGVSIKSHQVLVGATYGF